MKFIKSFFKSAKFFWVIPRRGLGNIFLWFKICIMATVIVPVFLQFPLKAAGQNAEEPSPTFRDVINII